MTEFWDLETVVLCGTALRKNFVLRLGRHEKMTDDEGHKGLSSEIPRHLVTAVTETELILAIIGRL